uniref:protein DD3-3-like n=1 Tax=Styela clava TaxID=7725 RepID=UPI001939FD4E|nr:protein DD3-3-like [Styela clava]
MVMLYGLAIIAICLASVRSDIYLHNPRGSNNRLDENSRDRNNANRLFDSQNNARGGYNVGSLYYYVDSELSVEWTNQHSCGDLNNHCEVILQYMCSDTLRDGISTSTIPEKPNNCKNGDCDSDKAYGMHEDFYYYAHCKLRSRNKGLFTADRNLNGESAKYTRQNNAGTRRGYECPEERDHYPYWGPTPWKDIAILTNDVSRCEYYQRESQNVKPKHACEVPYQYLYIKSGQNNVNTYIPIEKEKCEAFDADIGGGESVAGVWKEYPSHNLPPPACTDSIKSRDNHLGNTLGGHPAMFNWTIFDDPNKSCTLRIRYNISTSDYDGWNTSDKANNRRTKQQGYGPDMWTSLGLSQEEAVRRGYYLKNDPEVDVFNRTKLKLALAINTAQFGRTFQDRTHRFEIRSRPSDLRDKKIYNLNVRGKRGNIVQVYPAVEYDYVPNNIRVAPEDYIHFQWTGSNDNPGNNDGQGRQSTDRSNVVPMKARNFSEGDPTLAQSYTYGHAGVSYPSHVTEMDFLGFSDDDKSKLASLSNVQFGGVMHELDDAGTYYDLTPRKVTMVGDFNYMCTRNNNFSNRSQKGKIIVKKSKVSQAYIGQLGGNVTMTGTEDHTQTAAYFPPQSLSDPQNVQLEVIHQDEVALKSRPPNDDYISNFVLLSQNAQASEGNPIHMSISLESGNGIGSLFEAVVYRTTDDSTWISLELDSKKSSSSSAHFKTESGGHFVVAKQVAPGPMAGLVIGLVVAVILIGCLIYYFRTTKLPFASYSSKV